jgi:hypothetical protein
VCSTEKGGGGGGERERARERESIGSVVVFAHICSAPRLLVCSLSISFLSLPPLSTLLSSLLSPSRSLSRALSCALFLALAHSLSRALALSLELWLSLSLSLSRALYSFISWQVLNLTVPQQLEPRAESHTHTQM